MLLVDNSGYLVMSVHVLAVSEMTTTCLMVSLDLLQAQHMSRVPSFSKTLVTVKIVLIYDGS